jgi:hypothetical protein
MPDTYVAAVGSQGFFQRFNSYCVLIDFQVFPEQSDAAGIIAPILQPLQAIDQDRLGFSFPYVANNAAHNYTTRLSSGMLCSTTFSALTRQRLPMMTPGAVTTLSPTLQCSPSIAPMLT